jgi:hypothetical protein
MPLHRPASESCGNCPHAAARNPDPGENRHVKELALPWLSMILPSTYLPNIMEYDEWPENTMANRRAMIRKTIRPVTIEELKQLGEKRFPIVTDPWCGRFNEFLAKNSAARFHRAEIPEGAEIVYCREAGQGVWFLPGSGMGIIQPNGLAMLAEIVDSL